MARVVSRWTGHLTQERPLERGARAEDVEATRVSLIQRWPIYSSPIVVAALLALYTGATATVESLPRPLLIALVAAVVIQLALSALFRSRHMGAYATLCLGLFVLDWPIIGAILAAVPLTVALSARIVRRAQSNFPWPRATEFLNIAGLVILGLAILTAWNSGSLSPVSASKPIAVPGGTGPDIYLILLDGHPRGDTMEADFGLDSGEFLEPLERLGFDVVDDAHSNYNFTVLTLTSLFNMAQVDTIPGLDADADPPTQYRQLARAINTGSALDEFRALGYEIVTVTSPAEVASLYSADRLLDDGSITQFEFELLESGVNSMFLPDLQRRFVMGSMRARVSHSLESTVALSRERGGRPKLVFTHVMSPHAPLLYTEDGRPIDGWPCYPGCNVFDFGWRYGDEAIDALAGQIRYIDAQVVDTVQGILAASEKPPVIVLFSDHGGRHDPFDHAEMLRSLMVAYTPGKTGVLPEDASPVNLLPRLLNAYFDRGLSLSPEDLNYLELPYLHVTGPLNFEPAQDDDP